MILAALLAALSLARPSADKGEPLILDGADRFTVTGGGRQVELVGNVRFHRGDVKLRSDKALWDRTQDVVSFNGAFRVEHPSGTIRSTDGRYERTSGSAWAIGNALLTDSTGKVTLSASQVRYSRPDRTAEATGAPVFRQVDPTDTTEVRAHRLVWQERERIAQALGNVTLRKGAVTARASSARLDEKNRLLTLQGNPEAVMGKRRLKGREMRLVVDLKERKIREIDVFKDAVGDFASDTDTGSQGQSGRLSGDTLHALVDGESLRDMSVWKGARGLSWRNGDTARKDELEGDSLRFSFDGRKLKQVRAWRKATGRFRGDADSAGVSQIGTLSADTLIADFEDGAFRSVSVWPKAKGLSWRSDDTARKDELEGDSIGFAFKGRRLDAARVKGKARSLYHQMEKGVYKGKNETLGDNLRIAFSKGRIGRVKVSGNTRGTWWGAPPAKPKSDSAGVLKLPAKAPATKSVSQKP